MKKFYFELHITTITKLRFMLVESSLSEDLVEYGRTVWLQHEYLFAGDPIFTNPVEVYSNIQGDLGVFA